MSYVLAIDQGTTSTRAIVFDKDLQIVASSQKEIEQFFPFPGWVEHGVRKVKIDDSDYFDGYGRYAITSFFGLADKRKETE